ncbi:hypothetical protein [Polynucleobacter sp. Latsch14-2]|uniref:hypothetical protein n=1 Tax=Polynucleobacter sp. Latsch14-2 TaxID=2576920 RepID=UPI001C0D6C5B|nr:hypothetical protein [Polynucleobacter sp. Latsch14-2]
MVLETSDRDGSLSLIIRREGVSASPISWSAGARDQGLRATESASPRPKNKRVTIHQSGRVNYHENGASIFIAPLTRTTQLFPIYGYRVPALDKLDVHNDGIADEDAVFDLSDLPEGPVSFSMFIGPMDFKPQGQAIKLEYEAEGYSVTVQVDPEANAVPADLNQHFITLTPAKGLFPEQQMAEDQAMISYHHALARVSGIVLYTPNGEGVIRMIFVVPMRIAPRFQIELVDPELHASDQDVQRDRRSEKVMLKFKVRHRRTGEIIRQPVGVKSIELDSEL